MVGRKTGKERARGASLNALSSERDRKRETKILINRTQAREQYCALCAHPAFEAKFTSVQSICLKARGGAARAKSYRTIICRLINETDVIKRRSGKKKEEERERKRERKEDLDIYYI